MAANLGSLRKILELERKKGYLDSAVMGGLDKFLTLWFAQLHNLVNDSSLLKRCSRLCPSNPDYALMNNVQRKEWVSGMLGLLDELENPLTAKTTSTPRTKSETAVKKQPTISKMETPKKVVSDKIIVNKQPLYAPVMVVKGISEVLSKKFAKLGVLTVHDLLYFFPHRHIDYSQRAFINNLTIGQENTIIANVWEAREVQLGTRRSAEATVGDETGNIRIVWFNQPYMARTLKTGTRIVISGKVTLFRRVCRYSNHRNGNSMKIKIWYIPAVWSRSTP